MRPARADDATVVFVGPSLAAAEVRAILPDAELRPPVAAADVVRLLRRRRPARLAIIDGYFERMAAVWHKELLLALEHGVVGAGRVLRPGADAQRRGRAGGEQQGREPERANQVGHGRHLSNARAGARGPRAAILRAGRPGLAHRRHRSMTPMSGAPADRDDVGLALSLRHQPALAA